MPVVLHPKDYGRWLDAEVDIPPKFLRERPGCVRGRVRSLRLRAYGQMGLAPKFDPIPS
ncbi:MAG: hypothetical protein ACM3YM_11965 [Sphingomonadales bacterium]